MKVTAALLSVLLILDLPGSAQSALDSRPTNGGSSVDDPATRVFSMGKYYRNARVERVVGDLAEIRSRDGAAMVKISTLPNGLKSKAVDLQRKAAAFEAAQAASLAKAQAAAAAREPGEIQSSGRVIQVCPEGLLVDKAGQVVLLRNHPAAANVADGETVTFRGVPEGVYKYSTTLGSIATVRVYKVIAEE